VRAVSAFTIVEWVTSRSGTLRGFVTVKSGMIFHNCAVHYKHGAFWVAPGRAAMIDRAGVQQRDAAGKGLWRPVISFATRELRDKFSAAVVEALQEQRPGDLDRDPV
jgi:hypothetical protein